MPINWEEFEQDVDAAITNASGKTDAQLAAKISSVTRFTDEEVEMLFPDPSDAKKLYELMRIVNSAEARNVRVKNIMQNSEKFADITLTLLGKFC